MNAGARLVARLRAGPDADLRHLPVSLNLRALSLEEGVRAALAVAALVALNEWLRIPALGEAGLGALLTCLCDPGGPMRKRLPVLLSFIGIGTLAVFGFSALRLLGFVPASIAATLCIFCTMFARAWGPGVMQVGNLLTVVIVLALDRGESPADAALLAVLFALGSLWALLLTMAIWRLHPFGPARAAVADVYRRLGTLAGDLSDQITSAAHVDWAAHARAHRRYVRDGIEAARTEVTEILRARGPGSGRGNALLIQIEAADQIFGAMIGFSDLLEHGEAAGRDAAKPVLPALRLMLAAIADGVLDDRAQDEQHRALFLHLLEQIERARSEKLQEQVVDALVGRLRVAALMTMPEGKNIGGETSPRERQTLQAMLGPLRSNLDWSSAALRHAVRTSVVSLPALLITLPSGAVYAHWLTITLILTLQPFFALTWQRALERGMGTVLGGIIAALLAQFIHGPVATAAMLFPLAVFAFAVRRVSFGLFMAGLTPLVVLLSELGQPETSEFTIALFRAGYTVAGGIMAVLGGLLLWPSWEPARVRGDLLAAIRAHAAYADSEFAVLLGTGTAAAVDAARRASGLASNNLETTLSRALQEPGQNGRREVQGAMLADAALRRVAGRLAALQTAPGLARSGLAESADLTAWREWVARGFRALADGGKLQGDPPADVPNGALSRIARQITLIDGALHPEAVAPPAAPSRRSAP